MPEIRLYKNGQTKSMWGERGASLLESQGWSRTLPTTKQQVSPQVDTKDWYLSPWSATGKGTWQQQPTLRVGSSQYKFATPQEYLSKMQGLTGGKIQEYTEQFKSADIQWQYAGKIPELIAAGKAAGAELSQKSPVFESNLFSMRNPTTGQRYSAHAGQIANWMAMGYQFYDNRGKYTPVGVTAGEQPQAVKTQPIQPTNNNNMPNYKDLIDVGGEIRTTAGQKFKDPTALAGYLGIAPHQIDWGQISKQASTPTPTPVAPTPSAPTPTPSTPTPTPTPTQANYSGLVNKDGTIQAGERIFGSNQELADYLKIQPHEIDWTQIPKHTPLTKAIKPVAPVEPVIEPTPKTTRSLIDIANSRPDVLEVAKSQGGDPFTAGTAANTWLNNWWNTAGKKEFPDVTLGPPTDEPTQFTEEANDFQEKLFDSLPKGDDDEIDVRESKKLLDEIMDEDEDDEKLAPPPSMADLFKTTKATLGMEPLEEDLARIDSEIDIINSELLIQQGQLTSGQELVTSRQLSRRKGTLQKEADDRILRLNIEKGIVTRQLNNKINSLNMIMKFSQQDYTNSAAYYKAKFDKSVQMYDLVSGEEKIERTIEQEAEDDAKANLVAITTAFQESGISYSDLTDDQVLQMNSLETQAGMPVGLFQFTLSKDPEMEIQTVTSRTTADGSTYFDVLKVGPNGEMVVDSIFKGVGKVSTTGAAGYSQKDLDKIARDKEEDFWKEIDEGKTRLTKGENWGTIWDRIKSQFPEIPNEEIDKALGIEWKEKGAYEKYRAKTTSGRSA